MSKVPVPPPEINLSRRRPSPSKFVAQRPQLFEQRRQSQRLPSVRRLHMLHLAGVTLQPRIYLILREPAPRIPPAARHSPAATPVRLNARIDIHKRFSVSRPQHCGAGSSGCHRSVVANRHQLSHAPIQRHQPGDAGFGHDGRRQKDGFDSAAASASASPSFAQQIPFAPAAIWRRAISEHLFVLAWAEGQRRCFCMGRHVRDVALERVEIDHQRRRLPPSATAWNADK